MKLKAKHIRAEYEVSHLNEALYKARATSATAGQQVQTSIMQTFSLEYMEEQWDEKNPLFHVRMTPPGIDSRILVVEGPNRTGCLQCQSLIA